MYYQNLVEEDIYQYFDKRLKQVEDYNLQVEVIIAALREMKADPSISIEDAFERGCYEWDV